jgi:hypothetical protein
MVRQAEQLQVRLPVLASINDCDNVIHISADCPADKNAAFTALAIASSKDTVCDPGGDSRVVIFSYPFWNLSAHLIRTPN